MKGWLRVSWKLLGTKSRKEKKKKNKIREKKKYLIDMEKIKGIYCEVFFL
jgi:hypothetical protein